jgi:hypothetical protein
MTIEALSSQFRARPFYLKPILDACVAMGLLHMQNGRYSNSHFSRVYLVKGESCYAGDVIKLMNNESSRWNQLYKTVQNDPNGSSDDIHETFIRGMNNFAMLGEADALVRAVDLSGRRAMVDAGGGSGCYSVAFCRKYPELRSILLDTKETLDITQGMIFSHEEKNRIQLKECDIFKEEFGKNMDVALLSDVVYSKPEADRILESAWNCLAEKGLLIVRGYYLDEKKSQPMFGALFAVNQMVFNPGKEIVSLFDLQEKIQNTGFSIIKTCPLTEFSSLIIATKNKRP